MHDDIDWMNASSDFGLIALCRQMAALAAPAEAASRLIRKRRAQPAIRARQRVIFPTSPAAESPLHA